MLSIHAIVLISIFNVINYCFNNYELLLIGAIFFSAILSFLFFNFPKARMFLGDSGSYLIGTIIAYLAIETSNQTSNISPFFFAILLFYPFFEVFFSFFRKILISQSSPLKPDKYHLHMILFKNINQNIKNKNKSNVLTSLIINVIFLLLIIPSIFIFEDSILCKLYFLVLIICYLLFYIFLNKDKNRFKKWIIGCGAWIWTKDLQVMSLTSYQTAPPRDKRIYLTHYMLIYQIFLSKISWNCDYFNNTKNHNSI